MMTKDARDFELDRLHVEIERLRRPWSAVVDTDWDFILNKTIGYGGHERFWRAVLTEMREALPPQEASGDPK